MSRQVVEIPIEVWEQCQRDAETIASLHKECIRLNAEVKRLTTQGEDSEPRFVLLSEYQHLKGLLAFATTKYCRLEAEVERLRKAGDMCDQLLACFEMEGRKGVNIGRDMWRTAKEGKQS